MRNLLIVITLLAWPAPAAAQPPHDPVGWRHTTAQVEALAARLPEIRAETGEHPRARIAATPRLETGQWDVSVVEPGGGELAYVLLDDRSGDVLIAWSGPQVSWPMARGEPGAFGGAVNASWVWIALAILFAAPFASRRPGLIGLDVAALLAFGLSYAAFNAADIDVSVPTVYPLLAYLLVRALVIAARGGPALRSALPDRALLIALVFLIGFRVAVTLTGGNVIDVGYSGVIGADRLAHGAPLYGHFPADNAHGDTYGPVAYAAYVPFELLFPWHGEWDALPAAQVAAATFDLVCIALCWLLGRRLGGARGGLLLAYLWAAYPFTLLVLASGANDALVAALVLIALLVAARPVARGVAVALAGLTKFAPFALGPLLATYRRGPRGAALTTLATLVATALVLAPFDLGAFHDRTFGFQSDRASPFSLWGLWDLGVLNTLAQLAAVALAIAVAFVPRRRDLGTLCALAAAVLIAVELALGHWFYLYLVWFAPLMWAAWLAPPRTSSGNPRSRSRHRRAVASRR
jgi:hypothetical protein